MSFIDEVKEILSKHPNEIVKDFIDDIGPNSSFDEFQYPHFKYYSTEESIISESYRALNALKKLIRHPLYHSSPFDDGGLEFLNDDCVCEHGDWKYKFQTVIECIESTLYYNDGMKPTGRPSNLTFEERGKLIKLKLLFKHYFPDQSLSFKKGTTLHKLGCALIGRELPGTTDKYT